MAVIKVPCPRCGMTLKFPFRPTSIICGERVRMSGDAGTPVHALTPIEGVEDEEDIVALRFASMLHEVER